MRGESERGQSERALSIYSLCAQRGGKLLFESTHGAYDFGVQCTGCSSKDERTETCNKYMTYKLYTVWVVRWAITGGN